MKKAFCLFFAAIPSIVLLAQTAPPARPADGTLPRPPLTEMLPQLSKRFPPEIMPTPAPASTLNPWVTTDGQKVTRSHSYCVSPDANGKSISLKRCEPAPSRFRLIAPFAPKNKPAK